MSHDEGDLDLWKKANEKGLDDHYGRLISRSLLRSKTVEGFDGAIKEGEQDIQETIGRQMKGPINWVEERIF